MSLPLESDVPPDLDFPFEPISVADDPEESEDFSDEESDDVPESDSPLPPGRNPLP